MDTSRIRSSRLFAEMIGALPPVVGRSLNTCLQMREDAKPEPKAYPVRIAFLALVLVCSNVLALNVNLSNEFFASVLTALSILAGFLMSVLLFTGSTDGLERLDHNTSRVVVQKINHLLRYQSRTVFTYFLSIAMCLAWFVLPEGITRTIVETLALSGMVYSLMRSSLLPLQLYELHTFRLSEVVKDKRKSAQLALLEKRKEVLSDALNRCFGDQEYSETIPKVAD